MREVYLNFLKLYPSFDWFNQALSLAQLGTARAGGSRAQPGGAALQEPSPPPCLAGQPLPCLLMQEMFLNLNNAADLRADSSDNEKKKELLLGNDCCFVTFP